MNSMPTNAPPGPSYLGCGEIILLVEDERITLLHLEKMLGRFNYQVLTAGSVPEALLIWSRHRDAIRAVVMDFDLGHARDGLSLLREFVKEKPTLATLMATGHLTPDLIEDLERTTDTRCLAKPFDSFERCARLRLELDTRRHP